MKDANDYYANYFKEGGEYTMGVIEHTSRPQILKNRIFPQYIKKGAEVLDIGCGDMLMSRLLPQYKWSGIDINNENAPKAVAHDLMQVPYPFKDESFDACFCSEVLEHLWEPEKVHNEVVRMLKPGGHYIVTTPNFDCIDQFVNHHDVMLYRENAGHFKEHIRWYNLQAHNTMLFPRGFEYIEHWGSDACISGFFQTARQRLVDYKISPTLWEADVLLGLLFPNMNPSIGIIYRKN